MFDIYIYIYIYIFVFVAVGAVAVISPFNRGGRVGVRRRTSITSSSPRLGQRFQLPCVLGAGVRR